MHVGSFHRGKSSGPMFAKSGGVFMVLSRGDTIALAPRQRTDDGGEHGESRRCEIHPDHHGHLSGSMMSEPSGKCNLHVEQMTS